MRSNNMVGNKVMYKLFAYKSSLSLFLFLYIYNWISDEITHKALYAIKHHQINQALSPKVFEQNLRLNTLLCCIEYFFFFKKHFSFSRNVHASLYEHKQFSIALKNL